MQIRQTLWLRGLSLKISQHVGLFFDKGGENTTDPNFRVLISQTFFQIDHKITTTRRQDRKSRQALCPYCKTRI